MESAPTAARQQGPLDYSIQLEPSNLYSMEESSFVVICYVSSIAFYL
jgi:hypothetical protein